MIEDGLVTDETVIVATVHSSQVIDELLPEGGHDFRVDFAITENDIIQCPRSRRPSGLIWESMPAKKIRTIPILGARAKNHLN
ncbi:hypothetical protein [Nonomuraea sp. NPDC049695]|uniref:hypothetical protein n=1 Tax=Nonomuraea sp. NPDC049695 TaxID=3154734 RepID=UPI003431F84A